MTYPYTPQSWVDGSAGATPIDSARLLYMENGITALSNQVATITKGVTPWYSVRAAGAVGNGITNDTVAIQTAINNAAAGGGVVYFPPGTYMINATLTLANGGIYIGDGWKSQIQQMGGANLSQLVSWPSGTNTSCLMADLLIDGNRALNSTTTTYGIYGYAVQNSTLRNVRVQNVNGDGFRFDGASGSFATTTSTVHMVDCWAYGNVNNGLVLTSFCADVHVLGGDYGNNGASAITYQGGSSSIRDAVLWGSTGGPGLVLGGPSNQIISCNIEGNNQQGILVNQFGNYCLINDCKIYDNSVAGSGSYDGVYINGVSGTPTTGVVLNNNFIYPNLIAGGTTQAHAINFGPFHSNCSAIGNNVGFAGAQAVWSPSNALINGQGTSDYVANNPGFNPMGQVTPPTLSSGTVITNPWGVPVTVYVSGGTVTQIQVGGVTTGLIAGSFALPPGGTIKITYSGAPTWIWMGE